MRHALTAQPTFMSPASIARCCTTAIFLMAQTHRHAIRSAGPGDRCRSAEVCFIDCSSALPICWPPARQPQRTYNCIRAHEYAWKHAAVACDVLEFSGHGSMLRVCRRESGCAPCARHATVSKSGYRVLPHLSCGMSCAVLRPCRCRARVPIFHIYEPPVAWFLIFDS